MVLKKPIYKITDLGLVFPLDKAQLGPGGTRSNPSGDGRLDSNCFPRTFLNTATSFPIPLLLVLKVTIQRAEQLFCVSFWM